MEESKDKKIEIAHKRQQFQMHKKGYEDVTKAIESLKEIERPEVQKVELIGAEIVTIKGQKGDKGDKPSVEELKEIIDPLIPTDNKLESLIKPLIPKPIKGEDGKDYKITEKDKKDIAKSIKVPIVEKVIEKTEIIKEQPIIKEVAKYETANEIVSKLQGVKKQWLDIEAIKGDFNTKVTKVIKQYGGAMNGVREIIAGTNVTIDNSNPQYPIVSSTGSSVGAFTDLTDVPSSYTGQGGKIVAVKADTTGLEFISSTGSDEKVKYDVSDPTAGYVADKIIAGTGISVAEGTGANENKLVVTNSAPDQTVALTNGTGISITGTYPNFTITNSSPSLGGDVTWGGNTNGAKKLIGSNDDYDIGFETNNTERLTILKGGNVGIGTTAPTHILEVTGAGTSIQFTRSTKTLDINPNYSDGNVWSSISSATGMQLRLTTGDSGTATNGLTINAGNVGIGTTTPTSKLHVIGATLTQLLVEANTAGVASPNIITSAESNTVYTNEGATALNYHPLPTAAAGLVYTFSVEDSDGIRIVANTGDDIKLGEVASSTAGYIESTTIGSTITLVAVNATTWRAISSLGTWALA